MADTTVFVLEQLKLKAKYEMEKRVEKHLKDQFHHKILPKVMDDVREKLIIDIVNGDDSLDIQIKIKGEE